MSETHNNLRSRTFASGSAHFMGLSSNQVCRAETRPGVTVPDPRPFPLILPGWTQLHAGLGVGLKIFPVNRGHTPEELRQSARIPFMSTQKGFVGSNSKLLFCRTFFWVRTRTEGSTIQVENRFNQVTWTVHTSRLSSATRTRLVNGTSRPNGSPKQEPSRRPG